MVQSTIQPKTIEIDTIKNGVVNLLAHWDAVQDDDDMWIYEECRMDWILPQEYATREEVEAYLASIEAEIIDWAKGSKVTL